MENDKLLVLINKEIDGTISVSEKKRLHDYMQINSDAHNLYDEMLDIGKSLDEMPEKNPPQHFTGKIMSLINHSKYAPKVKPKLNWGWLYSPRYRLAYSFIGGFLLGVVLLSFLNNPFERDVRSLSGTMGIGTERIAVIPISAENATGNIVVTRHNREYVLEITLESNEIYEININYNPDNIQFSAVVPAAPQKAVVERAENQLRLSGYKNAHHILKFDRQSDKADFLNIMVIISQEQIVSKKLILE